jgi:hypothetical protein
MKPIVRTVKAEPGEFLRVSITKKGRAVTTASAVAAVNKDYPHLKGLWREAKRSVAKAHGDHATILFIKLDD